MNFRNMITEAHQALNRLHDHHLEPKRKRVLENKRHLADLNEKQREQLLRMEGDIDDLEEIISIIRRVLYRVSI